ncbi:MAG: carbon-nitrogen hydrolase [Phycisphaeraceae bacterium]|nr:carbon-nitrogen hydrolase [Phycisphaeraceae bacterium]
MPRPLQLALLQHACPVDASKADHLAACERLIRQAAGDGAQLIVTQELFAGHYFPQAEDEALFDLAEPVPGPTSRHIAALATELGVTISVSLFEKRTAGVYHNTTATFGPDGSLIGKYRKMHIPDDPRFYEKYYFTPGDLGWQAFAMPSATVGTLVCWDQWFPEAARLTALKGAELLLYPTAIGYYNDAEQGEPADVREQQLAAWRTMMQGHAIANGVFVAAANRIGKEDDLTFWGSSFVCGPDGAILAQASRDQEEVLHTELDLDAIEAHRRGWPFLRDRRIDAYQALYKRVDDA